MTIEEAIKTIEVAKAEVEWNYPLDYQIAFDKAIEALEEKQKREEERKKFFEEKRKQMLKPRGSRR